MPFIQTKFALRYQHIDMKCPYCHKEITEVKNSRPTKQSSQIWRRRQCWHCKAIFTTHETPDLSHLIVLKKSGQPEMFNHMKLYTGIYRATVSKTKNRSKKVDRAVNEVESDILFLKQKRIKSQEIGEIVLNRLKKIDIGMFLRFLAYFTNTENQSQMKRELEKYLT